MQEEPFPSRNKYYLWTYKVVASEVTSDMVASVQPIFLFKPVGMARQEINNAFLSICSFKLLSVTQRLLRLDTDRQQYLLIFGSASDGAPSTHSRHLKNSSPDLLITSPVSCDPLLN